MRFRAATWADIPILADLKLRADATHSDWVAGTLKTPSLDAEISDWQHRMNPEFWCEVAVGDDDEILGVVAFMPARVDRITGPYIAGRAHINAVFVDPRHHRKGIGRALLVRADDAMRGRKFREAQLWTLDGSPAERLYEAAGWARDGRREHYPPMDLYVVAYLKTLVPAS